MAEEHVLQNAQTILASTPDAEITRWMEASFILLERIAGPGAKNVMRQRERRDLDGMFSDYCHIVARIKFEAPNGLSPDAAYVKYKGEMIDAQLRAVAIQPKKMH